MLEALGGLAKYLYELFEKHPTFYSGLFGTVVGGVIAFSVQQISLREARKQRLEDRRKTNIFNGNSLLFRMVTIHSNIAAISNHIDECLNKANKNDKNFQLVNFILPVVNIPNEVNFKTEEMSFLLEQKNDKTFNAVFYMDTIHNRICSIVKKYSDIRSSLSDTAEVKRLNAVESGSVLTFNVDSKMQVKLFELNSLAILLLEEIKKSKASSLRALFLLSKLLSDNFGITTELIIEGKRLQDYKFD